MRLSFITLFVSFLSLSFSVAKNPQFLSRHDRKNSPVPSVIPSRQYHLPRSLLDLCVNARLDLFAGVGPVLGLGPLDLLSKVHICLCLKDLDIYLATNTEIQSLIQLLGPNIVGSRIRAIINTSPHTQKCTFPQHAHHTCNTKDPCRWACDENYVRDGDKCVCAPPLITCNGVCGLFPKGCSSAISRSFHVRTHSVSTLSQAKASCMLHETVCGIAGREDSFAFECIDTALAKDSCGGCMSPHRFHEVDPVPGVSGQDCTRIPNVKNVGCYHSRCIITSCQEGWIPNSNNTGCTVHLAEASGHLSKRSDPLSLTVTANTVVDSDILTQLVAVVDVVLHLSLPSSTSSANVTTTFLYGVSLLNDVNTATANLISSRTIRTFLQNIDHLLDVSSLFNSWLTSSACVSGLGISELIEEMNSLIGAVAELRTFCFSHPVISGPESPTVTVLSPSATVLPDHPLAIRPSDLLSGLQLNGGVIIQGLHDTNVLLGALGLGADGHHSPTPEVDSDLSNKIAALVHLVVALKDDLAVLPHDGHPTSIDLNLFVSIGQVLLNATTVADVVASLEQLVALSNDCVQVLENCGCIDSLGLQQLQNNLEHIVGVALEALAWCHDHPVVPGLNIPLANKTSGNVRVVVGLPDHLNHPTLGDVGISNPNGQVDIDPKPRNLVDPNLLSCLEVLVNLVAKLHVSMTLTLSAGQPCIGSTELAFVKEMVDSLTCITPSTTLPDILISVNRILVADSSLEKALETCLGAGTVKDLVEVLVKITKVTVQLGDLCGSSKTTLIHYSTATLLPTTSRLKIVTSRPSSHRPPTTTTPFSVTVGRPTATRSLSTASPTRPSSSDDVIIVSLDHLLSTLGLGGIKGIIIVEGLGHELNEPVNTLLDDLQIGPHDLRRREIYQVIVQDGVTPLTLQANVDALIDRFINLVDECGAMKCSIGTPQRDFLDASLQQFVGVLTATSWSKFVGGLDRLTIGINDILKLLDNCECITDRKLEGVYRYMMEVFDASLVLQSLCRQVDISDTVGVNGQPMVVGLSRLLKGMAIERRSAAR